MAVSNDHRPAESYSPPPSFNHSDCFKFQPIHSSDVLSALQNLDVKKSAGPDGIFTLFLLEVTKIIAEPLTSVYYQTLSTGAISSSWKQSNVTPVHKGGDVENPGNFPPISVAPIVAKVLEKLVAT